MNMEPPIRKETIALINGAVQKHAAYNGFSHQVAEEPQVRFVNGGVHIFWPQDGTGMNTLDAPQINLGPVAVAPTARCGFVRGTVVFYNLTGRKEYMTDAFAHEVRRIIKENH